MWSIKTKILLVTFTLLLTVSVSLSIFWGKRQETTLLNTYLNQLLHLSNFEKQSLETFYQDLEKDILFMANNQAIQGLGRAMQQLSNNPADSSITSYWINMLNKGYETFLRSRPDYFQIRVLDASDGMELVRIERDKAQGKIIQTDNLQNKQSRYYFQESIKLKAGQVYFSPIDLNHEFHKIELPHRPTLRAATPIFNQKGKLFAVLVINTDIEPLLHQISDHLPLTERNFDFQRYLANKDGYWLAHPDVRQLFAFEFQQDDRLQIEFPELAVYLDSTSVSDPPAELIKLRQQQSYALIQKHPLNVQAINKPFFFSILTIKQSEVTTKLKAIYLQVLITAFITTIVLVIALMFIIEKLLKPIHALVETATVIGQGNYETRLPEAHDKETHKLVDALKNLSIEVKNRETRLLESEARSKIIIENVPVGILLIDEHGNIQQVNTELEKMTGYDDGELINQPIEVLVPENVRQRHIAYRDSFIASHGERDLDNLKHLHAVRKNGSEFPVNVGLASMTLSGHTYVLATLLDITSKLETEERLWREANFDALTKLPNRKMFYELLEQEQRISNRSNKMLWLLFLDLDGFKEINDTFGHDRGDELLIEVARRLKAKMRETDILARLGGDEFVILLTGINSVADVDRLVSIYIKVVASQFNLDGNEAFVSTSIGIANYPGDATNTTDLMRFADQAMYQAKADGKNRAHYFTPALQEASILRLQISTDLRRAITRNELMLHYQPVVNLTNGKICKAEALIRWSHPQKGLISPAGFIPIAEETGVIHDIGEWIFAEVIQRFSPLDPAILECLQIAINVSPVQLSASEEIYRCWIDDLKNTPLKGKNIVIEFTEGLLLSNDPQVSKRLINFRDNEVQVAIDDFGTGYSSLAYLKEFDIDYIKIDQSFIKNLKPGSSEESLVEAIIVMAHKLDMQVIAEGIETAEQLAMVKNMGCDYGQGYFFSRPIPCEQFIEMLELGKPMDIG